MSDMKGRRRTLAVAAASAIVVSGALPACAAATDRPAARAQPASVAAVPSVHTREAATRLAADLLDRAVAPPGSKIVSTSPLPALDQVMSAPSTPNLASSSRFERVPMASAATVAFFAGTVLPGFALSGPGGSTFTDPTVEGVRTVYADMLSIPDGVAGAGLLFQVVAVPGLASAVRIDAQVTWLPPKPAAAEVPGQDAVAEVSRTPTIPTEGLGAPTARRSVLVTDPAGFRELADSANRLRTDLPGVRSCPADVGTRYGIAFSRSVGAEPDLVLTAGICGAVLASARGIELGVLSDSRAFSTAYLGALGLPSR